MEANPVPIPLSIIIPAYNERLRLPATIEEIAEDIGKKILPQGLEVVIVDDGSTDQTGEWVQAKSRSCPYPLLLVSLPENKGKGAAVRAGLSAARGENLLISDADASTPFREYPKLAAAGADIAIASRGLPQSRIGQRQPHFRHFFGKLFNRAVRFLSGLNIYDTQCGFKLFSKEIGEKLASQMQVDNYAWDIEFLMLAKKAGLRIAEVPVFWTHKEDSRVNLFKDGLVMLTTMLKLRKRLCK